MVKDETLERPYCYRCIILGPSALCFTGMVTHITTYSGEWNFLSYYRQCFVKFSFTYEPYVAGYIDACRAVVSAWSYYFLGKKCGGDTVTMWAGIPTITCLVTPGS